MLEIETEGVSDYGIRGDGKRRTEERGEARCGNCTDLGVELPTSIEATWGMH